MKINWIRQKERTHHEPTRGVYDLHTIAGGGFERMVQILVPKDRDDIVKFIVDACLEKELRDGSTPPR